MATYIISYDLSVPGQKYSCIEKVLEPYGTKWRFMQSTWIVETNDSAKTLRDKLESCLDNNDKLFVGRLSGEAAWHGFSAKGNSWLKTRLE